MKTNFRYKNKYYRNARGEQQSLGGIGFASTRDYDLNGNARSMSLTSYQMGPFRSCISVNTDSRMGRSEYGSVQDRRVNHVNRDTFDFYGEEGRN